MDGRGGCCIARYVGGGAYDMSKVDRIMLRFRPIAPKPIPSGSVSGDSTPEKSEVTSRSGRGKRKYVKDKDSGASTKRCNRKKMKASPESKTVKDEVIVHPAVTLPLLPETPERKEYSPVGCLTRNKEVRNVPVWLSFETGSGGVNNQLGIRNGLFAGGMSDRGVVTVPQPMMRTVTSCVTVENVTDTWVDGEALGWTDEERRRNLERDTCPGFISDGVGKVTWTNEAYKKMVGEEPGCEMRVWLVMKETPPWTWKKPRTTATAAGGGLKYPAFTCRVKVEYTCRKEKNSLTVPCDAWRMERGGFAWRLDVKAALSLGR